MSANKEQKKKGSEIELKGTVTVKGFGSGSKSEHNAIYLDTEKGSFVLRRVGGNPFNDPSLHQLKGKLVTAKGIISNYLFLAKEIKVNPA